MALDLIVVEIARLERDLQTLMTSSPLPPEPDFAAVDRFLIEGLRGGVEQIRIRGGQHFFWLLIGSMLSVPGASEARAAHRASPLLQCAATRATFESEVATSDPPKTMTHTFTSKPRTSSLATVSHDETRRPAHLLAGRLNR